jgi:KDO2-lipid IV(A) lauroyltransferase
MMYYPVLALLWLLHLLPDRLLYLISDLLYLLCFRFLGYRKAVVYQNLTLSFPEKSPAEIHDIASSFYRHFCDLLVEIVNMMFLNENRLHKMVTFKNTALLNQLYDEGKSVIIVQGHFMNWELSLIMGDQMGKHDRYVIYKTLSSNVSERLVMRLRERLGSRMLAMYETRDFIESHSRSSQGVKPALFQLGADQAPMKHKIEYWTTFMNQETPFFLGPEKLARHCGFPVVYLDMQREARGKYIVSYSMLEPYPSQSPEFSITTKYVGQVEDAIKRDPSNWLWTHRRWKHQKAPTL